MKMMTTGAFEANDSREELRASLSGSSPSDYQDLDDDFEVYPLPSRWLTSDPVGKFGIPAELALGQFEYYSRRRPTPRASWDATYVAAANDLVGLIMEAPKTCPQMHTTMGELNDPKNAPWC